MTALTPEPTPAVAPLPAQRYPGVYPLLDDNPISAGVRAALVAVRRHFWMAVAIVGATLALALVSTMLQTPRYTASTSVQINDQSDEVLGKDFETNAVSNASDWDVDRFLNTQMEILRSRALAERVVDALDLANSDRFAASMELPAKFASNDARTRREIAVDLVKGNMAVDLPRETRIANIQFTSVDPAMSARIADTFAAEFIQSNLQRRFDASAYARNFVSDQLQEARADLERAEQDLNDYAKSQGMIRSRDTFAQSNRDNVAGTMTTASLLQYNDAAIGARAARIEAQSRWEAVRDAPLLSSTAVLSNPTIVSLMSRRAELDTQLKVARERYLDGHPSIERLETELAGVNSQINRVANTVRESVRAQYEAAVAAEQKLDREVGRARGATVNEQDKSVRYNTLSREADTARSIYEGLLQRFRELNASAGIATSNIAIIDKAEIPGSPSSPNLARNLGLGLLVGLVLAGLAIFLRDQLDDVIHTPEDVEEKLGLTLLGVVPRTESEEPIEALDMPKSPVAEAYFSLRGALLYSTPAGLPKVMVVTSAQANEGKTTTSYAMAEGLSRIGLKPLLIDADLRRPSLHTRMGIESARGLTDLLVSLDDPMSAVVKVKGRKFDVLPAGPMPPSPSELLSSPRMAQLLEAYAGVYDVVIVDSPPVLGLADAPMLAAIADGTVFVVEADRGRSGALKAALRRLRSVDPLLLGAVFVKFDPSRSSNRYSAYFGRNYYEYGQGRDQR